MFRKWKLQAKKVSFFENFDFSTHQSLSTSRESSFLALYIDLAICYEIALEVIYIFV